MTSITIKKTSILFSLIGLITLSACHSARETATPAPPPPAVVESEAAMDLETYLTQNDEYIKVPITKMPSGHLHVNVIINGVPGEFILDTGAGATVVEAKRKEKFKLTTESMAERAIGAGGSASLERSTNNNFRIGALEKPEFTMFVMDLDHVNRALVSMKIKEVDGIIGADLLTSNQGIIDYAKLILYLKM